MQTDGFELPRTACRFMSMYCGTDGRRGRLSQPDEASWLSIRHIRNQNSCKENKSGLQASDRSKEKTKKHTFSPVLLSSCERDLTLRGRQLTRGKKTTGHDARRRHTTILRSEERVCRHIQRRPVNRTQNLESTKGRISSSCGLCTIRNFFSLRQPRKKIIRK